MIAANHVCLCPSPLLLFIFTCKRILFPRKRGRGRKGVTTCRGTACQCAQGIRNFRESSKAVQVPVRSRLLFMSQGVLDGKEALALLSQNGGSQMPDGVKSKWVHLTTRSPCCSHDIPLWAHADGRRTPQEEYHQSLGEPLTYKWYSQWGKVKTSWSYHMCFMGS